MDLGNLVKRNALYNPDKAKVREATKERTLNQFGGIGGILTFNHKWLLDPVNGGTGVTQHEEYRGIGVQGKIFGSPCKVSVTEPLVGRGRQQ